MKVYVCKHLLCCVCTADVCGIHMCALWHMDGVFATMPCLAVSVCVKAPASWQWQSHKEAMLQIALKSSCGLMDKAPPS